MKKNIEIGLNFFDLAKESYAKTKDQLLKFLLYAGVFMVLTLIADTIVEEEMSFPFLLIAVLIYILQPWYGIGMMRMSLKLLDSKIVSFEDFYSDLFFVIRYIGLVFLSTMITFFLLLLFIVPGIIAALTLFFSAWVFIDKGSDIFDSLSISKKMTYGYRVDLAWLVFWIILFNIAGALVLGIGLFFTAPFSIVIVGLAYQKISHSYFKMGKTTGVKKLTTARIKKKTSRRDA
jgi:hypothetical protein